MIGEKDTQDSSVAADAIELWRQWNETTSKAWLNALQNSAEATTNSYNRYRSWLQNLGESGSISQEQAKSNPFLMQPTDVWKTWFDATMETWRKAVEMGGDPLGLTRQWLHMMEEVQSQLLAGTPLQTDPFTLFKQWYDATNEQWSKVVEQTLRSKNFLEATRPLLESYASVSLAFRRASEAYFHRLHLSTTSDVANVAQLVINLEEKVDTIEDLLEDFQATAANSATREEVAHLDQRLNQLATTEAVTALEQRLTQLPTTEVVSGLEQRLNQLATTEAVSSLEQRLNQLPTSEVVGGLAQRMNQVEDKLDKVLAALEKLQQNAISNSQPASDTRPRKSQKKSVSQESPDVEV